MCRLRKEYLQVRWWRHSYNYFRTERISLRTHRHKERDQRSLEEQRDEGGKKEEEAYHVITFSLTGLALTPAGGSDCILWIIRSYPITALTLKSRIKRRRALVDIFTEMKVVFIKCFRGNFEKCEFMMGWCRESRKRDNGDGDERRGVRWWDSG